MKAIQINKLHDIANFNNNQQSSQTIEFSFSTNIIL